MILKNVSQNNTVQVVKLKEYKYKYRKISTNNFVNV